MQPDRGCGNKHEARSCSGDWVCHGVGAAQPGRRHLARSRAGPLEAFPMSRALRQCHASSLFPLLFFWTLLWCPMGLNLIFVFFFLSTECSRNSLGYYCICILNVLKNIRRDPIMRYNCQTIAKVVDNRELGMFPVHMLTQDSKLHPED
jgi:hypothetical protein